MTYRAEPEAWSSSLIHASLSVLWPSNQSTSDRNVVGLGTVTNTVYKVNKYPAPLSSPNSFAVSPAKGQGFVI